VQLFGYLTHFKIDIVGSSFRPALRKTDALLEVRASTGKFAFGCIPMLKNHFYNAGDAHLPYSPSLRARISTLSIVTHGAQVQCIVINN
jgi:hypothetical protein